MNHYKKLAIIELAILLLIVGGLITFLLLKGDVIGGLSFITGK
jgi:hypothetical protein